MKFLRRAVGAAFAACTAATAFAAPRGAPLPPPIPVAAAVPYPGLLTVFVDASDTARHVFRVRETVPVRSGPLTLSMAKWIPGEHSPFGPIGTLGGLVVTANGQRIEWSRDTVEMSAFHVEVPVGVTELTIELTQPAAASAAYERVAGSTEMLAVRWNALALYPAGYAVSGIRIQPSVRLPEGWQFATALDGATTAGATTTFAATSFETVVDSPLYAGRHVRRFDLDPGAAVPVRLDVFAENEARLDATAEQVEAHRRLVREAYRLFGSRHYDHYDFLLGLSDDIGFTGIEHHRSSENIVAPKYFSDWDNSAPERDLLPHEYVHSWNGKFRRPADLWTPDYTAPMRDSLLWVYEGQTEFWGWVLAARSGLLSAEQVRDHIAIVAADLDHRAGRRWRSLQDTTNAMILRAWDARGSASWLRGADYYAEGLLIWLDADSLIRERSGGTRSLDDFARAFFGVDDGSFTPLTYTFDDVVAALQAVLPYDWARFLRDRLDGHGPGAPLDGLARGGYRLVYTSTPSAQLKAIEVARKSTSLDDSIGVVIGKDAEVTAVQWEGPAFEAGLTVGATLVAVNGVPFDADVLKEAIGDAARPGTPPIELLVKADNRYRSVRVDYHGGLRYPKLERIGTGTALLDALLAPKR